VGSIEDDDDDDENILSAVVREISIISHFDLHHSGQGRKNRLSLAASSPQANKEIEGPFSQFYFYRSSCVGDS
jgi:hypothetical protein